MDKEPKKESKFEIVIESINEFLGILIKILAFYTNKIDCYGINKEPFFDADDFVDDKENHSILTTLMFLAVIPFSLFFMGLIIAFNIIMFIVSIAIAPYIGKVILYTVKILALITSLILVYYILLKFNKVNSFVDKDYINVIIKTFQKVFKIS